ncbi:unnamed protein product [Gadus morhua 'NCC']
MTNGTEPQNRNQTAFDSDSAVLCRSSFPLFLNTLSSSLYAVLSLKAIEKNIKLRKKCPEIEGGSTEGAGACVSEREHVVFLSAGSEAGAAIAAVAGSCEERLAAAAPGRR